MPAGAAISIRHGGPTGGADSSAPGDDDESCPVCKTTRYFNKDMEFVINPECYHRMCRTCVDRIFKDGPNQCPYAGCHKTLRLRGFRPAYFSDLGVEREVDIRRRVAAVFNNVEEDFETLDAYNDYLYKVECLTDDMVNGNDDARRTAVAELEEWEAQHKAEIERNRKLAREGDDARKRRLEAEAEATRRRRMAELQEDVDEKANSARMREQTLDNLTTAKAGHAKEVYRKIELKKRGQAKAAEAEAAAKGSGLSIRGLRDKKKPAVVDDKPYDPFGGLDLASTRVDTAPDKLADYTSEWVAKVRTDPEFTVGGYSSEEFLSRALFEAFSGLGVFVGEEMDAKDAETKNKKESIPTGAMDVDDVL